MKFKWQKDPSEEGVNAVNTNEDIYIGSFDGVEAGVRVNGNWVKTIDNPKFKTLDYFINDLKAYCDKELSYLIKDDNGFDWEELAQKLITDFSELDGPFESCKRLLYHGLTIKQLVYLGFEQETIVRAIKEFKEENPQ